MFFLLTDAPGWVFYLDIAIGWYLIGLIHSSFFMAYHVSENLRYDGSSDCLGFWLVAFFGPASWLITVGQPIFSYGITFPGKSAQRKAQLSKIMYRAYKEMIESDPSILNRIHCRDWRNIYYTESLSST